jgi:2-iminobutanoate/2-iminopropanoate deaminase
MWRKIETTGAALPIANYSQAVDSGSFVFTAGQLGQDPETGELSSEFIEEARQCLRNVQAVLQAGGLDMPDIVKTTVFLTDLGTYEDMTTAYGEFFEDGRYPARSTVKVAGLLANGRIEIEAVAVRS